VSDDTDNNWRLGSLEWIAVAWVGLIRGFAQQGLAGAGSDVTLGQIWWALAVFMGTQVVAGLVRVQSKKGV
jgi:hypothetical protein